MCMVLHLVGKDVRGPVAAWKSIALVGYNDEPQSVIFPRHAWSTQYQQAVNARTGRRVRTLTDNGSDTAGFYAYGKRRDAEAIGSGGTSWSIRAVRVVLNGHVKRYRFTNGVIVYRATRARLAKKGE